MPTEINGRAYRMVHERLSDFLSDDDYKGWYCGAEPVTEFGEFVVFRGYVKLDADGKHSAQHTAYADGRATRHIKRQPRLTY